MEGTSTGLIFEHLQEEHLPLQSIISPDQNGAFIKSPESLPLTLNCSGIYPYMSRLSNLSSHSPVEHAVFLSPDNESEWKEVVEMAKGNGGSIYLDKTLQQINNGDIVVLHDHPIPFNLKDRRPDEPMAEDNLSMRDLMLLINGIGGNKPPRLFGTIHGNSAIMAVRTDSTKVIDKPTFKDKASLVSDFIAFQVALFGRVVQQVTADLIEDKLGCELTSDPLMNLGAKEARAFNLKFAKQYGLALYQINNIHRTLIAKKIE